MNEIVLNAGGRRLYNEDVLNLQDHLISLQNIFAGEDPFVLSGLEFTNVGGSIWDISAGFLWLGGKIRTFGGVSALDLSSAQYLNVNNSTEARQYDDNNTRVAINIFGVILSTTAGGGSNELRIDIVDSVRRYYNNVLGDRFLKLSLDETQTIVGNLSLQGELSSTTSISTSAQINAGSISVSGSISVLGSATAESLISNGDIKGDTISTHADNGESNIVIKSNGKLNADTVETASITDLNVTEEKLSTLLLQSIVRKSSVPIGFSIIKTYICDIGNWDMYTTNYASLSSTLPIEHLINVSSINVAIYKDNGSSVFDLVEGGQIELIDATGIGHTTIFMALTRDDGKRFDSIDFSDTGNRGRVTITYVV